MKTKLVNEFKERFDLSQEDFNKFLQEYQDKDRPLRTLCEDYKVDYNSFRYFAYQVGFNNSSKAERVESVLKLNKDLAIESGADYDIEHKLEVELESVVKENLKLRKSVMTQQHNNNVLRKEIRLLTREDSFEEEVLEELRQGIPTLASNLKKLEFTYHGLVEPTQEYGNIMVLGDSHFGDLSENDTSGNTYNHEFAHRRMLYVVDELLKMPIRSEKLIIVELLDILKGLLHASEYLSEGGITGSMLKVIEVYSDIIDRIHTAYKHIDIYVSNSNHDRTTQKPTSYMKWDNFGIMLMKMLEVIVKAKGIDNVKFHFTKKEHHLIKVNGANIFTTHGDSIRQYQAYSKAQRNHVQSLCLGMFKEPYKHMISGHTHQSMAVSNEYGGYNIVNGTLVGNTEYGITNGFSSIEPTQTIFNIDERGNIENLNFINLSHIN